MAEVRFGAIMGRVERARWKKLEQHRDRVELHNAKMLELQHGAYSASTSTRKPEPEPPEPRFSQSQDEHDIIASKLVMLECSD
jgi:hypothetical protein